MRERGQGKEVDVEITEEHHRLKPGGGQRLEKGIQIR